MFSWKVLWSTALILTLSPDSFSYAATRALRRCWGTSPPASFDPKVTVPVGLPPPPPSPSSSPPQAASRAGRESAALVPRAPLRKPRRPTPAATDGGTRLARYAASDSGLDMSPPRGRSDRQEEHVRTDSNSDRAHS